ncbi:MAG TPA: LysR family transcriptional regulator [Rickettsiales bacterium]|nr:LysR family transcriptional regulator [Rickettsiales bacterium]
MHAKLYNDFYYKKDRLNQIRGFCALVQTGDIVQAATKIGVQPSSVSKQIKALERDLGIRLFKEKKNIRDRLVLSEDGMKFYEHALELVQKMDSIYREFAKDMEYERTNVLRIAGSNFILSAILPKYIYKLKEKKEFEDLIIEFCDIPKQEALERFNTREIDIAFYPDKINSLEEIAGVERKMILEEKTFIVCRTGHPLTKIKNLTKKEVEKYPYLFLKSYSNYNPKEIFNFTKQDFLFERLDWNLMKVYLLNSDNLLLAQETFCKNIILNDDNYDLMDIEKLSSKTGVYYFLPKRTIKKDSLKYLIKLISNDKSVKE